MKKRKLLFAVCISLMIISLCRLSFGAEQAFAEDLYGNAKGKLSSLKNHFDEVQSSLIEQDNFDEKTLAEIDHGFARSGPLSQNNIFHLANGNALFVPKKNIQVITALTKIYIPAGAIVCVLKPEAGSVSIYNFSLSSQKKISLELDEHTLVLPTYTQATICYEGISFENVNPASMISLQHIESKELAHGLHLYESGFSVSSAVTHLSAFQQLLSSKNADDQQIARQLLQEHFPTHYLYQSSKAHSLDKTAHVTHSAAINTLLK